MPSMGGFARFSIVTVARDDSQIWSANGNTDLVKRIFGKRNIVRVETDQILCAQSRQNVVEGGIQVGAVLWAEYGTTRTIRHRSQRVFASDVAAGRIRDRHVEDRIYHGVSALSGTKRDIEVLVAGRVAAVRHDDQHMTPFTRFQILTRKINGVVHRSSAFGPQCFQGTRHAIQLACKVDDLAYLPVESVQGDCIVGIALTHYSSYESQYRIGFVL